MPAGLPRLIEPAGEMWSVVTESPSMASTRAPWTSVLGCGSAGMPSKYGGRPPTGGRPAVEVRRAPYIGRRVVPGEGVAGWHVEALPALIAGVHVGVALLEHAR